MEKSSSKGILNGNPYENLAISIVTIAADDYRRALNKLRLNRRNRDARISADEVEHFFRSEWFRALTSVDPEYLMGKIKEEFR